MYNLFENDKEYLLELKIGNLPKDSIQLNYSSDTSLLSILPAARSGYKSLVTRLQKFKPLMFYLPAKVKEITHSIKDGVLTLTLLKENSTVIKLTI